LLDAKIAKKARLARPRNALQHAATEESATGLRRLLLQEKNRRGPLLAKTGFP
jgi:hypothetical protein